MTKHDVKDAPLRDPRAEDDDAPPSIDVVRTQQPRAPGLQPPRAATPQPAKLSPFGGLQPPRTASSGGIPAARPASSAAVPAQRPVSSAAVPAAKPRTAVGVPSLDLPPPPPLEVLTLDTPAPAPSAAAEPTAGDPFALVGSSLSDTFKVESVVAHGGFAVVYKAMHLRFASPVAIKCLKIPTNLTQAERAEFLDRFQKEGEVMFRLSSSIPEVVRPLQFDSFKSREGRLVPFIALEWLEGETLKDVIVSRLEQGKPPLSLAQAVTFLAPVAKALVRAHRLSSPEGPLCILHCDLKPDNIFVTELGGAEGVRIFDFGIAKVRNAATRQVGNATTDNSQNMFTPAYAAPEQWTPDKYGQTGPWTDVFSLALTLTELVTQKAAIDGAPAAMLAQCLNDKVRPTPRRLGLSVPDRLDAIFLRALAVDPKLRYQTISKFWGDLEEALGLPAIVGEAERSSMASIKTAERAQLGDELDLAAPPPPSGGSPMFAGELDLGLPHAAPAAAPPAAPAASADVFPPGLGLAFDLPGAPPAHSSSGSHVAVSQPFAAPPPEPEPAETGFGPSLDLAAGPEVVAPPPAPSGPGLMPEVPLGPTSGVRPATHSSQAGMPAVHGMPAANPYVPTGAQQPVPEQPAQPDPAARERLQAVAAKAGQVGVKAAATAASAAKLVATKALEVDERHLIRLDEPATWIKPMMGPIIAMGAALVISIGAVIVNKASGSNVKVVWISLPLMLAAIGFAVYRWMKITKE